jgi:hypothetical protein
MKGADPDFLSPIAEKLLHPFPHLSRRLVRKRYGQNVVRANAAVLDKMRDAIRNRTRFSAPRSGKDQQRAFRMPHGFKLLRVQIF